MGVVRNAIAILEKLQLPLYKETIQKVLDSHARSGLDPRQMLKNSETLGKEAKALIE